MQLLRLDECQAHLRTRLETMDGGECIHIRHLGLDLGYVKEIMIKMLEEATAKDIRLELLVITSAAERLDESPPIPQELEQWCANVEYNVNYVLKRLRSKLDERLRSQHRTLRIQVKHYTRIPAVHGFSLEQLGKPIVTYLSFNRWTEDGRDIEWGIDRYREIIGDADDLSFRDLREIFSTTFAHYWHTDNSEAAFEVAIGAAARQPLHDAFEYDVFLSFNSEYKNLAEKLAHLLREENLEVWFDDWAIRYGDNIIAELSDGLTRSRTALVLFGSSQSGPYQKEEMLELIRRRIKLGSRVIPVLLPTFEGNPDLDLPPFLGGLKHERLPQNFSAQHIEPLVKEIRRPSRLGEKTGESESGRS